MVTVLVLNLKFPLLDILGNDVVMQTSRDGWVVLLSSSNESSHDILVNSLMILLVTSWSNQVSVDGGNVDSQSFVTVFVLLIQQKEDQIETREESFWQIDVFLGRLSWVVPSKDRVSSRKN